MKYPLLAMIALFFISCSLKETEDTKDYTAENEAEILAYIEANDLDAIETPSGLYYVIEEEGTGDQPTAISNVKVAYKGYFTNNQVFDESPETGITFNLQEVIRGWTEGIQVFKEGGKGKLLIPSRLAYGNRGTRFIPGGKVLVFDIHLIDIP